MPEIHPHLKSPSLYFSHGVAGLLLAYARHGTPLVQCTAIVTAGAVACCHYLCRTAVKLGPAPMTAAAIGLSLWTCLKQLFRASPRPASTSSPSDPGEGSRSTSP